MIDVFPDLDLYNTVYKICKNQNIEVYDDLEAKNKVFPFLQLQDIQFIPIATKSHYLGTAYLTINLYDLMDNKKKQSTTANNIMLQLMRLKDSKHYRWNCNINTSSVRYIIDKTTSNKLSHAIINVEMKLR